MAVPLPLWAASGILGFVILPESMATLKHVNLKVHIDFVLQKTIPKESVD